MKLFFKSYFSLLLTLIGLLSFSNLVLAETEIKNTSCWFPIILGTFFVVVFIVYPICCWFKTQNQSLPLKGLNLPQGSVRSMIALSIIGSFLITLSLGRHYIGDEHLDMVLAAFGSLSGAVIGFYFGSGGSGSSGGKTTKKQTDE